MEYVVDVKVDCGLYEILYPRCGHTVTFVTHRRAHTAANGVVVLDCPQAVANRTNNITPLDESHEHGLCESVKKQYSKRAEFSTCCRGMSSLDIRMRAKQLRSDPGVDVLDPAVITQRIELFRVRIELQERCQKQGRRQAWLIAAKRIIIHDAEGRNDEILKRVDPRAVPAGDDCGICQEPLLETNPLLDQTPLAKLNSPCPEGALHFFHKGCIREWVTHKIANPPLSCPMCRRPVEGTIVSTPSFEFRNSADFVLVPRPDFEDLGL